MSTPVNFYITPGEVVNIEHLPEDQYPVVFSAIGLPDGLHIDPVDGRIYGTSSDVTGPNDVSVIRTQTCRIGIGGVVL